jgi:hypothetical protein
MCKRLTWNNMIYDPKDPEEDLPEKEIPGSGELID